MSLVGMLLVNVQGANGYRPLPAPQIGTGALIPAVGDLLMVQRTDGVPVHLKVVERVFSWPEPGSVMHRDKPGLPVVELFCREAYGPHPLDDEDVRGVRIMRLEQP